MHVIPSLHGVHTIAARKSGLPWLLLYLALIMVPLGVLLLGERPRGNGFWWDFALLLGYAGLAMMGVQFALTARFKRATAPFGIDLIYYFHRFLATAGLGLLLLHIGLLAWKHPDALGSLDPRLAPRHMTFGRLAILAFSAIIVSSLWRKQLHIEYDHWRRLHVLLALSGVVLAVLHVQGAGAYLQSPWKRALWSGLALSWLLLAVWVRLVRPALLLRRPWRVSSVQRERGRSWTLTLTPERGGVFAYHPGQFAWLTLRASPFALREHPFSLASSPTREGSVQFTIKELGDFTRTIGDIRPGERAYIDGPYGSFGIDRHPEATGFVFIAGGVGIAPMISMLRAMADRGDRRPLWLFYGNRDWERVLFREELDELAGTLALTVVHVLGEPPVDWDAECGVVDRGVLQRHLPPDRAGMHYLVCGPGPMIESIARSLDELGVPAGQRHSEIFDIA
ncbi:MAG TPA: ferric reductase-like transmembrane domain-containing protein [Lysobacter sp.]|nr:ferric reductase-like transmembrane domain-containing protein [Lysobacter sp.]